VRIDGRELSLSNGVNYVRELNGSPNDIADTLRGYRAHYGISYSTVMEFHAECVADVIVRLR
jgi:hypothetical protein